MSETFKCSGCSSRLSIDLFGFKQNGMRYKTCSRCRSKNTRYKTKPSPESNVEIPNSPVIDNPEITGAGAIDSDSVSVIELPSSQNHMLEFDASQNPLSKVNIKDLDSDDEVVDRSHKKIISKSEVERHFERLGYTALQLSLGDFYFILDNPSIS